MRVLLAFATAGCAVGLAVSYALGAAVSLPVALGFTLVVLTTTWFLAGVDPRRPWDAAAVAVAPLTVLVGPWAWDVLGTGVLAPPLLAAALWASGRGRVVGARVLWVGAGAAVLRTVIAHHSAGGGPDGSWWLVAQQARGEWIPASAVLVGACVFALAWCAGVVALTLRAPQRPRIAQVALLVGAGVLLSLPVVPPVYALWLLPLAVVARPRWRDLLVWQVLELVHAAMHVWYLDGLLHPVGQGSAVLYWLSVLARAAGLLWLVGTVVRDVVRPDPKLSVGWDKV